VQSINVQPRSSIDDIKVTVKDPNFKTFLPKNKSKKSKETKKKIISFSSPEKNYVRTNVINMMRDYKMQNHCASLFSSDSTFRPQAFFSTGLDQTTLEAVGRLTEEVAKINENGLYVNHSVFGLGIDDVHDESDTILARIQKMITDAFSEIGEIGILVVCSALIMYINPSTNKQKLAVFSLVVFLLSRYTNLLNFVLKLPLMKWLRSDSEINPQALEPEDFTSAFVSAITLFMGLSDVGKLMDVKKLTAMLTQVAKIIPTVKCLSSAISIFAMAIFSFLKSYFNESPFFLRCGISYVDAYMENVKKFLQDSEEDNLVATDETLNRVRQLLDDGNEIVKSIPNSGKGSGVKTVLMNMLRELTKTKDNLLSTGFKFTGIRPEPTSILMRGNPGVGKSVLLQHIAHALAALTLTPEELAIYKEKPSVYIYNRQAENEYWDGYDNNKKFTFFDDILQAKDIAGNADNEAMNIIRANNIFEYVLHCAKIDLKGNTFFKSDFVIANTNRQNFQLESIHEIGAFLRRWDVVVDVSIKPEFSKNPTEGPWSRTLDPTKLPRDEKGDTHFLTDCCSFQLKTLQKADCTVEAFVNLGCELNFDQLIEKIHSIYLVKKTRHTTYQEDLNETLNKFEVKREISDSEIQMFEPQARRPGERSFFSVKSKRPFYEIFDEMAQRAKVPELYSKFLMQRDWTKFNWYEIFLKTYTEKISINPRYSDQDHYTFFMAVLSHMDSNSEKYPDKIDDVVEFILETDYSDININEFWFEKFRYKFNTFREGLEKYKSIKFNDELPPWCNKIIEYMATLGNIIGSFGQKLEPYAEWIWINIAPYPISFGIYYSCFWIGATISKTIIEALSFVKNYFFPHDAQPESDSRQGSKARVPRHVIQRTPRENPVLNPQGLLSPNTNLNALVDSLMKSNLLSFYIPATPDKRVNEHSKMQLGYALALRGRSILIPYHFMSLISAYVHDGSIRGDEHIVMKFSQSTRKHIVITVDDIMHCFKENASIETKDLTVVTLPRKVQPFRDIMKHIASDTQFDRYVSVDSVLVIPNETPSYHYVNSRTQTKIKVAQENFESYDLYDAFQYPAHTEYGDCGSVLFVNDSKGTGAIIGIHVAGSASLGVGLSTKLRREELQTLIMNAGETYEEDVIEIPHDYVPTDFENVDIMGVVPQGLYPNSFGKSKLKRSPFYGSIAPVTKAPAKLSPFYDKEGVRIDPMHNSLASYGTEDFHISEVLLEKVKWNLYDSLCHRSSKQVAKEVFNYDVAVLGDPDVHEFSSIPRNTSAGYPYNLRKGLKSKQIFFGNGQEYDLFSAESLALKDEVLDIIYCASQGKRKVHIFTDCLKDEKRSLEKSRTGNTRMFSASPTPLLIASRMYFGAFQVWILKNRIDNGCTLGVNPFGSEWDYMAKSMLHVSNSENYFGAGDYKGFDKKQVPQILWCILDIINKWYGGNETDSRIRHILFYELVHSRHINRDNLVQWWAGMPSGHPMTSFVNCLYNQMLFRLCFTQLVPDIPLSKFDMYVNLQVHGDDNIFSVNEFLKDKFTERHLASVMSCFGMQYTPEDKTKTLHSMNLRSLKQISFLKRSFRISEYDHRYVAPLDLEVILDMLNWRSSESTWKGDFELLIDTVYRELCLHDKSIFEKWTNLVHDLCLQNHFKTPLCTSRRELYFEIKDANQ
jgi:hypothetical protein